MKSFISCLLLGLSATVFAAEQPLVFKSYPGPITLVNGATAQYTLHNNTPKALNFTVALQRSLSGIAVMPQTGAGFCVYNNKTNQFKIPANSNCSFSLSISNSAGDVSSIPLVINYGGRYALTNNPKVDNTSITVEPANQWAPTTGLYGGGVVQYLEHSSNLYAVSRDGLYVSSNYDNPDPSTVTWTSTGTASLPLHNYGLTSFVVDVSGNFYVGTDGAGVYKSANSGSSWTAVNSGISSDDLNITALGFTLTGYVLAGTETGNIYVSFDNGATWGLATGYPSNLTVSAFVLTNIPGGPLYAGFGPNPFENTTVGGGVYTSSNSGQVWTSVNAAPLASTAAVLSMNVDASRTKMYVGTEAGHVYSFDGTTWTDMGQPNGVNPVQAITTSLASDSNPFAGTVNGVSRYSGSGTTWNNYIGSYPDSVLPINANVISLYQPDDSFVFASSSASGVLRSSVTSPCVNTGCWQLASSGFDSSEILNSLTVGPDNTVYAGSNEVGVFKYIGSAWNAFNNGPGTNSLGNANAGILDTWSVREISISDDNANMYIATDGAGVFKATTLTGTPHWSRFATNLTTSHLEAVVVASDGHVYTADSTALYQYQSGTFVAAVLPTIDVQDLVSSGSVVYATTDATGAAYTNQAGGVWRLTNAATNAWAYSTPTPWQQIYVRAIAIGLNGEVYMGGSALDADVTSPQDGLLFKSIDGGVTWVDLSNGLNNGGNTFNIQALAVAPNGDLLAGTTQNGVYKLTYGSTIWASSFDNNDLSVWAVYSLAAQPSLIQSGDYTLFAGTLGGGVWMQ